MNLSDIILMRMCTKKLRSLSSSAKCLGAWRTLSLLYESGLLVAPPFKGQVHATNILEYSKWSYPRPQEPNSEYPDVRIGESYCYPKRDPGYCNTCIGYAIPEVSTVYIDLRNIPIGYFRQIRESEMKQIAYQCAQFGVITPLSPLEYEYLTSHGIIVPYLPIKRDKKEGKKPEKPVEYSVTVSLKEDDSHEALKVTTRNFDPLTESMKIRQQEPLNFRERLILENKLTEHRK